MKHRIGDIRPNLQVTYLVTRTGNKVVIEEVMSWAGYLTLAAAEENAAFQARNANWNKAEETLSAAGKLPWYLPESTRHNRIHDECNSYPLDIERKMLDEDRVIDIPVTVVQPFGATIYIASNDGVSTARNTGLRAVEDSHGFFSTSYTYPFNGSNRVLHWDEEDIETNLDGRAPLVTFDRQKAIEHARKCIDFRIAELQTARAALENTR